MKVLSLNCRGLNGQFKRLLYFKSFTKYDIICLQETYVTAKNIDLWKFQWDGLFFYTFGTSNSKGQIILINKRFPCDDVKFINLNDRCIGITFFACEKLFAIFNIYAPSVKGERIGYIVSLTKEITKLNLQNDTNILFCGDMNMVMNNTLDNISGENHSQNEVCALNNFVNTFNLIDIWRFKNPEKRDYSWARYNPFVARRIDYTFCNKNLKNLILEAEMSHFSSTDHKAVTTFFNIENFPRGPGTWYFNDSLLDEDDYDLKMKNHLTDELLLLSQQHEKKSIIYDLLKISVRDFSKAFSRGKRINMSDSTLWDSQIKDLNDKLIASPNDMDTINTLRKLITKKEVYELAKSKGAQKRARAKNIENGEKNTKLFLNLEKSRQAKKIIRSIRGKHGKIVHKPNEILSELRNFSKNLMTATDNNNFEEVYTKLKNFMGDISHPVLSDADRDFLEAPVTLEECKSALKELNFDSSPGQDGLTPSFYLHFWEYIKTPFFESLMESIQEKRLSTTQRKALISLLYKGNEYDIQEISSWRPISLTNTDYKIYSKVLANRVQTIIKSIISSNQVAYIKGRSISEHIRLIDDIINIANIHDLPGFLISLDFQKAFDTISKFSILAALKKFNFGPVFIQYVETILNETEAAIKNGGWISEFFSTTRGVRQGCCLSPLLFIIVVEFLALKIKSDSQISGILEGFSNYTKDDTSLLQYADDMNLLLKTTRCISRALVITDEFETFTGLKLNKKKSIGMGLGQSKGISDRDVGITWKELGENMRVLGVFFNASIEASLIDLNWKCKLEEIKKTVTAWSRRNPSLLGKCLVAKTFLLSKITYIIQSLNIPTNVLNEFDALMFRFLWKNKDLNVRAHEKIKRNVLCLDSKDGGINMISLKDQQQVMLIRWLQKGYIGTNQTQQKIINNLFKEVGGVEYIINTFITSNLFKGLNMVKSYYWRNTIKTWVDLNSQNVQSLANVPLFNNKNILYKGHPIYIGRWIKMNCKYTHDFIRNGVPKPLNEIKNIVGAYGGLIPDYLAVFNAVSNNNVYNFNIDLPPSCVDIPLDFKMDNKSLRLKIVKMRDVTMPSYEFWKRKYNVDLKNHMLIAINSTKETKLRYLHLRFIHNIYPTNILLRKMYLKDTNICDYCIDIDFIDHAFYNCKHIKEFWIKLSTLISTCLDFQFTITASQVLLGIPCGILQLNNVQLKEINHLILIAKLSIVKSKASNVRNIWLIFEQQFELRKSSFHFIKC